MRDVVGSDVAQRLGCRSRLFLIFGSGKISTLAPVHIPFTFKQGSRASDAIFALSLYTDRSACIAIADGKMFPLSPLPEPEWVLVC